MDRFKIRIDLFISYLVILFPIFMILSPLMMNLFSIIMSIYVFLYLKKFKEIVFSNEKFFILIASFFLFIFPYDGNNFEESSIKYAAYFRHIFMFFGIIIFFSNIDSIKLLNRAKKFYIVLLSIISIDVLKEHFTGTNFLGFYTDYEGRIASFSNDELIIGYIFAFLVLFSFGIISETIKKHYTIIIFYIIIIISFLIGERSNFLKLLLIIIFFSFFHLLLKNKFKLFKSLNLIFIISLLTISFLYITKNTNQAKKLYNLPISIINNYSLSVPIIENFYDSKHAPHYLTALKIFVNHPIFGIGINNFREESKKQKYNDTRLKYSENRTSTHPHQIYLELLAEVGILGFLYFIFIFIWSFIAGIRCYLKDNSLNLLGHLMLHIFFIFPILPSGSFFGTIYGLPFWFNLSILIYLIKKNEIKMLFKKVKN